MIKSILTAFLVTTVMATSSYAEEEGLNMGPVTTTPLFEKTFAVGGMYDKVYGLGVTAKISRFDIKLGHTGVGVDSHILQMPFTKGTFLQNRP